MKKQYIGNRWILILMAIVLFTTVAVLLLVITWEKGAVAGEVRLETQPNNVYDRTLIVAGDADYDPYTFLDHDGEPCGHDIELLYELADRMGYNVEVRLQPWEDAVEAVRDGDADMVLTLSKTPEDFPELALSIPLVSDPFVAFGHEGFEQIGELYGKRLAVLTRTGVISDFIRPYALIDNTTEFSSITEAFEAVQNDECDYILARYSVGRRAMAHLADSSIAAVGPVLLNEYVCIGVSAEDGDLLNALNEAIVSVSADGTLEALSHKWLGHYVDMLTFDEFLSENTDTIVIILGAVLLAFLTGLLFLTRATSRRRETVLKKLAEHDRLTGLYNRTTCEEMIRDVLGSSDPKTDVHTLLVIDMDNFKTINDTFGHLEGDAALVRLADGLRELFRAGDVVGRLGGDEFIVFMSDCTDAGAAERKAGLINGLFSHTYRLGDTVLHTSASVGIAMYPREGQSFTVLYKSADDALYETKRRGKSGYAIRGADAALCYHKSQAGTDTE